MPVGITGTVDVDQAEAVLLRFGLIFDNDNYLKVVGQSGLNWVNKNFRDHGTEQPWRPLSPNTLANPKRGGAGAQPLRDTGRMAASFVVGFGAGSVSVGTEDKKAKWHNEGTD